MLSSSKEPKNIPLSISILHEQEYNNLCMIVKYLKFQNRRAYSEKNKTKVPKDYIFIGTPLERFELNK